MLVLRGCLFIVRFFPPPDGQVLSLWSILFTAFLPTVVLLHITSRGSFFQIVTMWSIGIIFFYVITLSGLYVRLANHSILADLVRVVIFVPVLFLVVKFVRKPALAFTHSIRKYWSFIWLLPFSIAVLLTYLIYSPINILKYPGNIPPAVALLAISIFSIVILYLIFRETENSIRHQRDGEILRAQLDAQKKQFELQEENIRLTKMYRHDMRHHITVVSGFLQKGETRKALSYLQKTRSVIEDMALRPFCSNSAAAVLSSYCAGALRKKIDMQIHAEIPERLAIDETELCAVLTNCIENAITACMELSRGRKWIEVLVKYTPGSLALRVRNPYAGKIEFDESGLPISTHPGRGIGTRSVSMIVQKYEGVLDISTSNGIYTIRAVLNEIKK